MSVFIEYFEEEFKCFAGRFFHDGADLSKSINDTNCHQEIKTIFHDACEHYFGKLIKGNRIDAIDLGYLMGCLQRETINEAARIELIKIGNQLRDLDRLPFSKDSEQLPDYRVN